MHTMCWQEDVEDVQPARWQHPHTFVPYCNWELGPRAVSPFKKTNQNAGFFFLWIWKSALTQSKLRDSRWSCSLTRGFLLQSGVSQMHYAVLNKVLGGLSGGRDVAYTNCVLMYWDGSGWIEHWQMCAWVCAHRSKVFTKTTMHMRSKCNLQAADLCHSGCVHFSPSNLATVCIDRLYFSFGAMEVSLPLLRLF